MSDRLLTAQDVAHEMGCSVSFVYKQRTRGAWVASCKISGGESEKGWRWTERDVEVIKAKCSLPLTPSEGGGELKQRYKPAKKQVYGELRMVK